MKHLFSLCLCASAFNLSATPFAPDPATEIVVYSPASSSPLHVSTIPTNAADVSTSLAFPSSYTGHRSVCTLPAICKDHMLESWTGGVAYEPGSPYGIALSNQAIGQTKSSPITPRINLVSGQSDRAKTFDQIREDILAKRPPSERAWIDNNVITPATIEGDSFKGQRIRVVRWLVNDVPVYRAGTEARVLLDKTIETDVRSVLTEADFLVGGGNVFDLDWNDLYREVIDNWGTIAALEGNEVRSVSYLIVVGDGATEWPDETSTNEVVALPSVITRSYGERRIKPTLPSATERDGRVTIRWVMDCPFEEGYTAFRIIVTSGGSTVLDSEKFYATPTNGRNIYSHTLNHTFNAGTYDWKIAAYNSKFSTELTAAYTNGVPFTVTGE